MRALINITIVFFWSGAIYACNNMSLYTKNVQCYDESACIQFVHMLFFGIITSKMYGCLFMVKLTVCVPVFLFVQLNENTSNRRLNDHDHINNVLYSHWPDNIHNNNNNNITKTHAFALAQINTHHIVISISTKNHHTISQEWKKTEPPK